MLVRLADERPAKGRKPRRVGAKREGYGRRKSVVQERSLDLVTGAEV